MKYKLLGRSGLRVSELCLGTLTFMEGLAWGSPKAECWKIFEAFSEAGGNFVDTSNSYGTSEAYLGEFMASDRARVVVGTRYSGSPALGDANSAGNHRKSLVRAVEGSLRRLRTDYIDLLWLDAWDALTPLDEVMRALDDTVRLGKVLHVGVCNTPAWAVARANAIAELRGWSCFAALQVMYNLLEREAERELLPLAAASSLGVTAWAPLASGFLSGKYGRDAGPAAGSGPKAPGRSNRLPVREADRAERVHRRGGH